MKTIDFLKKHASWGQMFGIMFFAAIAVSCRSAKTIPNDELSAIFVDMYEVTAYCQTNGMNCDSIDVYTPVLQKYGYDANDFIHTLGNFTRRKTSRLSDIVEEAIRLLDEEYAKYSKKVQTLEKIDSIALEMCKEVVYEDSLIEVRRKRDTVRLRVAIPVKPGSYRLSYGYRLDSLDENSGLQNRWMLIDSLGKQIRYPAIDRIRNKEWNRYETFIEVDDRSDSLILTFGNYGKNLKTPHLTIDSLRVVYYPPKEEALEVLKRSIIDYRLMINGREYDRVTKDSSTLRIVPPQAPALRDTVAVE